MKRIRLLSLIVVIAAALHFTSSAEAQYWPVRGFGNGVYTPNAAGTGGDYEGTGLSTVLGFSRFVGTVEITGVDPNNSNILYWQNRGQGTADEEFQINRTFFGNLKSRVSGQVTLIPMDPAGTTFTAVWTGQFEFVGGTGFYRNASGFADVVAVNLPFQLTDPEWDFLWSWEGKMRLR